MARVEKQDKQEILRLQRQIDGLENERVASIVWPANGQVIMELSGPWRRSTWARLAGAYARALRDKVRADRAIANEEAKAAAEPPEYTRDEKLAVEAEIERQELIPVAERKMPKRGRGRPPTKKVVSNHTQS